MTTRTKAGPTLRDKVEAMRKQMRNGLIERELDIEIFLLALLSKQHAFFIGEPGIAKSMMVKTGVKCISGFDMDVDYYYHLFMKTTVPSEVWGPLDLLALREGRYRYLTQGYLPDAKIGFGDEYWKAGSTIQNGLLLITNEREFRNDGRVRETPLHSMFFASNEMPENMAELAAAYDRILFRHETTRIRERGNFIDMLELSSGPKVEPSKQISWNEIEEAHAEVMAVNIPRHVLEAFLEFKDKLEKEEIRPSDRRFAQSLSAVKAHAWLLGETEADTDDLQVLQHVMWETPDQAPLVKKLALDMASPLDRDLAKLNDDIRDLSAEVESAIAQSVDDDELRIKGGKQYHRKVRQYRRVLHDLEVQAEQSQRSRQIRSADGTEEKLVMLAERVLTGMFNQDAETLDMTPMRIHDDDGNLMPVGDDDE